MYRIIDIHIYPPILSQPDLDGHPEVTLDPLKRYLAPYTQPPYVKLGTMGTTTL